MARSLPCCAHFLLVACLVAPYRHPVSAGEWPAYGGQAARNHATTDALPNQLLLQWRYQSPQPPHPAWPNSKRLDFDRAYHPVIADGKVLFGSSADDTVTALDVQTGRVAWQFTADGPVRFAPTCWQGRAFVVSDDGHLYALALADGRVLWKHAASPHRQLVLGNGRLISRWAARGGPVVFDNTVYYAAGIWPSDGVFVHALDCQTGEVVWSQTDLGTLEMDQPHGGARAESGIAPQGYLLADEKHLYIPTGRAVPAVLDRRTGKLLYYHLQRNRDIGGSWTLLADQFILNGGAAFRRSDGSVAGRVGLPPMAARGNDLLRATGRGIQVDRWADGQRRDRKGKLVPFRGLQADRVIELDNPVTALLVADRDVACGFAGKISAIDFKAQANEWWHAPIEGTVLGLAYGDGVLVATTDRGTVYAFAGKPVATPSSPAALSRHSEPSQDTQSSTPPIQRGYVLVEDATNVAFLRELANHSSLHVVALAHTDEQQQRVRRELQKAGVYGTRIAVLPFQKDLLDALPRHFANWIIAGRADNGERVLTDEQIDRLLHPTRGIVTGALTRSTLESPRLDPDAGSWTHQWADSGNTVCSNDRRVRGQLHVTWFGSFDFATPNRHGQGPAPLCHRGYLVVGGVDGIACVDAYNGTLLWTYAIPGFLADYDGIHHDVGVGETGGRFCMSDDAVFVAWEDECLKLDLQTGKCVARFRTPAAGDAVDRRWGVVYYRDGVLIGSILNERHRVSPRYALTRLRTESTILFAVDAQTGKQLWQYTPKHSIRNNAVAVSQDRVFLIDRPIARQDYVDKPRRGGRPAPRLKPGEHPTGTLVALDLKRGDVKWRNADDIWGTQLSVSRDGRVVLMAYQAMKHKFFRLPSEIGGMLAAFDGESGKRLWQREAEYRTRPILLGDEILAEGGAWDLRTGEPRVFPFQRSYGCGQIAAGAHILLYRSATLGYWDLSAPLEQQRTRSFGGMRPGCYINAIPAGGIVLVPEGSTHCRCSYQLKSWFALSPAEE